MNIIYENKNIIAINKPANLETQDISAILKIKAEPVHRLDKDTTGVVLMAKNEKIKKVLQSQFKKRLIIKEYLALVTGKTPQRFAKEGYLARDPKRKKPFIFSNLATGSNRGKWRYSKSEFEKIQELTYKKQPISLLEVKIFTGRTHQIRVHLSHEGFPILGDKVYNNKTSQKISHELGVKRQILHAGQIQFKNPLSQNVLSLKSPAPQDIEKLLEILKKRNH